MTVSEVFYCVSLCFNVPLLRERDLVASGTGSTGNIDINRRSSSLADKYTKTSDERPWRGRNIYQVECPIGYQLVV